MYWPEDVSGIKQLLTGLYTIADSADYLRDMRINQELSRLLTLLMSYSWHPENKVVSKKRMELRAVREYLDGHFTEKIVLEDLSRLFYIDKYYLTKIFKEAYGMTISSFPPHHEGEEPAAFYGHDDGGDRGGVRVEGF